MVDLLRAHSEYYSNIYKNRELIWILAKRDLAARYKGSVLGFLWTFLNPLLLMLTYSLVFRNLSRFEIPDYSLFVLQGVLIWQAFSACVNEGSFSLLAAGGLVTKTPLPPEVIPFKVVLAQCMNLLLAFCVYAVFAIFIYKRIPYTLLALPLIFVFLALFFVYLASVLSVLSALYRDIQQLVGNILTILFFATPVVYSFDDMAPNIQNLLLMNPVAQVFRITSDVIFWGRMPHGSAIFISFACLLFLQVFAVFVTAWFRRRLAERI